MGINMRKGIYLAAIDTRTKIEHMIYDQDIEVLIRSMTRDQLWCLLEVLGDPIISTASMPSLRAFSSLPRGHEGLLCCEVDQLHAAEAQKDQIIQPAPRSGLR